MQYLKTFQSLVGQIEKAGGTPIAITSEEGSQLPATRQASGYQGTVIVDPENTIAKELKSRGIVDVAISEKKGYPHGMAQPAVIVMKPQERTVIHSWAIVPKMVRCFRPVYGLCSRKSGTNCRCSTDEPRWRERPSRSQSDLGEYNGISEWQARCSQRFCIAIGWYCAVEQDPRMKGCSALDLRRNWNWKRS